MTIAGPILSVANVAVEIGGRRILNDCSLGAKAGEFLVLAGPNGAGKSTFLRTIAGLQACSGSVKLAGDELAATGASVRVRRVSYLPQGGAVHWPMAVRDVVALGRMPFGARLQRLTMEDSAAIDKAIADCDIAEFANQPVTELSGGELSRVLLARALATQSPILLLDEPAASLDPAHASAVMRLLRDIADRGHLVLAVSHDIVQAARFATRIVLMNNGAIAADGPPSELFASGAIERIFGMRFRHSIIEGEDVIAMLPPRGLSDRMESPGR